MNADAGSFYERLKKNLGKDDKQSAGSNTVKAQGDLNTWDNEGNLTKLLLATSMLLKRSTNREDMRLTKGRNCDFR